MNHEIKYGPHLFPEGPLYYIRSNERDIHEVHNEIMLSFVNALNKNQEGSIAQQIEIKNSDELQLSFINYGNTELVYLLTVNKEKYTILINQPHIDKAIIKNQFQNLCRLHTNDSRFIVNAHSFFEEDRYAMYLTEYINNALCVGNEKPNMLGVWNPLPYYHFEEFNKATSDLVNISRIAHLVNLYDDVNQMGISKTQISGNDFMLTQDTDFLDLQSIIENTRIIGARESISISFEHYIKLIKEEFQVGTSRTDFDVLSGRIKINHHSKMSISKELINEGIEQGYLLRK